MPPQCCKAERHMLAADRGCIHIAVCAGMGSQSMVSPPVPGAKQYYLCAPVRLTRLCLCAGAAREEQGTQSCASRWCLGQPRPMVPAAESCFRLQSINLQEGVRRLLLDTCLRSGAGARQTEPVPVPAPSQLACKTDERLPASSDAETVALRTVYSLSSLASIDSVVS